MPLKIPQKFEAAIFAGRCFWCLQSVFEKLDGIKKVIVDYTRGSGDKAIYQNYANKGHLEAVKIIYDPSKLSYDNLLNTLWRNIDPTDVQGQFVDRGSQYRSIL